MNKMKYITPSIQLVDISPTGYLLEGSAGDISTNQHEARDDYETETEDNGDGFVKGDHNIWNEEW